MPLPVQPATHASATLARGDRAAQHAVDVRIVLAFTPHGDGSRVTWTADLVVRGPARSVGQRVARGVSARVIGDVLRDAAAVA